MNFSLGSKSSLNLGQAWQFPAVADFLFPFGKQFHRAFWAAVSVLFGLMSHWAQAAGDASAGKTARIKNCERCHGLPQAGSANAFSDYGTTANTLSVYASDAGAITRSANAGYIIPQGNTNDKEAPGNNTNGPMGTWAGMAENRLGSGTIPTQLAIDISAYFATYFALPETPAIGFATAGVTQAKVTFIAPKSDLIISSVRAGSRQAKVFFTAPAEGALITGYTVTALADGIATGLTASGTKSPITVFGLTDGMTYTFTVVANYNTGKGISSLPSDVVTPLRILGD